jgi:energy-converting hydrogenase A subunit M
VGNSEVRRYITAMNSHNGKGSVVFGATNEILNMTETGIESKKFFQIFNEMDKFRHTSSVHTRVNNAIKGLFGSITKENQTTILMEKMSKVKVKDEVLREIMFKCYKIDLNKSISELPTRTQNRIKQSSAILEGEIKKQDGSMWGLFQGVLKNTELNSPKKNTIDDNVYAGSGRAINMKAFNVIKDYINTTI